MRELHPLAYTKKGKKSCICYTWMEQINSDVKTYQRSKVRGKIKVKYRRRQKNRKKSIWKTPSQSVICILIGILPVISYLLLHNHLFTFSLPLMLFFERIRLLEDKNGHSNAGNVFFAHVLCDEYECILIDNCYNQKRFVSLFGCCCNLSHVYEWNWNEKHIIRSHRCETTINKQRKKNTHFWLW